jgi:hypothetical protein
VFLEAGAKVINSFLTRKLLVKFFFEEFFPLYQTANPKINPKTLSHFF